MTKSSSSRELELLLRQNDWVRPLAGALVRDPHAADDITQELYQTMLTRPPEDRGRLDRWVRTVLRNLARRVHRDQTRRRQREHRAARPEASTASPDGLERVELQRQIAGAVLELDPPLQTVVLLRFYEGYSSAEIARQLKVPAATIRSRLRRALEQLRTRLDASRDGDRERWVAPMILLAQAPSAPLPTVALTSTLLWEGVLLKTTLKVAGAIALLLCGFWFTRDYWGSSSTEESNSNPAIESTAATDPGRETATSTETVADTSAANESPSSVTPQGTESPKVTGQTPPLKDGTWIIARFVDEDDYPIPDVRLQLHRNGEVERQPWSEPSDADGNLRHEVVGIKTGKTGWRVIRALGSGVEEKMWQKTVAGGKTLDLGTVRLGAAATIQGRVLNERGMPVPTARLHIFKSTVAIEDLEKARLHGPAMSYNRRVFTREPDGQGRFTIDGVPPGEWRVAASDRVSHWTWSEPIAVAAGQVRDGVDLTLQPLAANQIIEGSVVLPNHQPASYARIQTASPDAPNQWSYPSRTDAEGRFVLRMPGPGTYGVRAQDAARELPFATQRCEAGTRDLQLRLAPSAPMELVVLGVSGDPLLEYRVVTYPADTDPARSSFQRLEGLHEQGVAQIEVQTDPFSIEVFAEGYVTEVVGPYHRGTAPPVLEVQLRELAHVRGRIMAYGDPVPNAYVFLGPRVPVNKKLEAYGFPLHMNGFTNPSSRGKTDEEGYFDIAVDKEDEYYLAVSSTGLASTTFGPYPLGPEQGRDNMILQMTRGGTLEGKVIVPKRRTADGIQISISRGDFNVKTQIVGDDGKYTFRQLAPGPWMIRHTGQGSEAEGDTGGIMRETELPPGESAFEWAFRITDGETTYYDFRLDE